jgi:MFS family permease
MLAAGRWQPRKNAGRILLVCVALFGVAMIIFGLSTSFWVSMIALFAAGLVDGVSMVIRLVILRVESPEALRGRIASVNHVFIGASNELGAFESGVAASILGVVPSVVFGGIVTLVVVSSVAVLAPQLRRLDLGRRLIEGPGVQPMATAAAGSSNIAAAEVDPGLEPVVGSLDQPRDGPSD